MVNSIVPPKRPGCHSFLQDRVAIECSSWLFSRLMILVVCLAGLEPVQEINGPLGMGGGLKDGALVLLQNLEPVVQVGGVVVAGFGGDAEVAAEERGPDLGDQFFAGVTLVAELLASEIPVRGGTGASSSGSSHGPASSNSSRHPRRTRRAASARNRGRRRNKPDSRRGGCRPRCWRRTGRPPRYAAPGRVCGAAVA